MLGAFGTPVSQSHDDVTKSDGPAGAGRLLIDRVNSGPSMFAGDALPNTVRQLA
jgi:hypothetical protein